MSDLLPNPATHDHSETNGNASAKAPRSRKSQAKILGAGDTLGAGDSYLVLELLPKELSDEAFERLVSEVQWGSMIHRGGVVPRLVSVQGQIEEDGSYPIYRHPADTSPPLTQFTPTVALIRSHVEHALGAPMNHVLIQHYRSGADFISEHADKTIDVVRGTDIVNVSIGAQRTMTLRTKKKEGRETERIALPHASMFVLGPDTNREWLHGINHDNRPFRLKSEEERYKDGERISLTFRRIGTFLTNDGRIYGQGATGKTKEDAREVATGEKDKEEILIAFGRENRESEFDWEDVYGNGSDVVDLTRVIGD